ANLKRDLESLHNAESGISAHGCVVRHEVQLVVRFQSNDKGGYIGVAGRGGAQAGRYWRPAAVVEIGRIPSWHLEARVVTRAQEQIAVLDWAIAGLPCRVADDCLCGAILELKNQLCQEPWCAAVIGALALVGQHTGVPAIAQDSAERVRAPLDQAGD